MELIKKFFKLSAGIGMLALASNAIASSKAVKSVYKHELARYYAEKSGTNNTNQEITKKATELTSPLNRNPWVVSPSPRIIGGEPAVSEDWPYIVSLVQSGFDPIDGHFCGGSLIRANVVLTASHCVVGASPGSFNVYVGSDRLSTSGDNGQIVGVEKIVVHESYSYTELSNDIALVFLDQSLALPIVPTLTSEQMLSVEVGDAVKVAGWGNMNVLLPEFPDQLQQAEVEYISQEVCSDAYEPVFGEGAIDDTMICAGTFEGGKDSCHGDSGGPLVIDIDGQPHQVGIVSFGNGSCAEPGFFGVYAKVPHFEAWIARNLSTKIVDHPLADANLQACLDAAAQAEGWSDIGDVTELICDEMGVSSLEGLSSYNNLVRLSVASNPIADISPIETLTQLAFLNIGGTAVRDISSLAPLVNLELIFLFDLDGIDCLDVNSGIFSYGEVASSCFKLIEDIQVVDAQLKNCITDVASSNGWILAQDIVGLSCNGYGISSLSGIEQLEQLIFLFADGNNIADLTPLSGLSQMEALALEGNNVTSIQGLENLRNLTFLVLWNNEVSDISPLGDLTSLELLDLENNTVNDISPLENLVNLQTIYLVNNPVTCMDVSFPFSYWDIPTECFAPPAVFIDTDGDGWFDFEDNCPLHKNANQKDTDGDGMGNRCDSDDDNDGFTDAEENQVGSNPRDFNSTPISILTDWDSDGILDENDNCPAKANPNQRDFDLDGIGNACDIDDDNDGFTDAQENNAGSLPRNPDSTPMTVIIDYDNDGIVDWEDNCMEKANANQKDYDRDGLGNACDPDDDNDGYTDAEENNAGSQPRNPQSTPVSIIDDLDSDGIPNSWDNCIDLANPNQKDTDQDGLGNACDRDDDNDGFTDAEESVAGTNPRNPASFPVG